MNADHIDIALEEMRVAMVESAKATSEANRLDERRKIIRSQLVKKFRADGKAVSESEHLAMASDAYESAVNEHYLADLDASVKKADADFRRIRFEAWRTRQANRRIERQG